jgi:hypothetical protein
MSDNGMIWHSNDKKVSISNRVKQAVDYYEEKYKLTATICRLHPTMFAQLKVDEKPCVELRPDRSISPGLLWIGDE